MREGFRKFKDFTIARDVIHVHAIKKELLEPGYPYIRVANFQESTDEDLTSAIKEFGGDEKIKGLVLDLRNNPGGLLDQAVRVSQHFIDKGRIVYTDGRVKEQQMEFRANSAAKHYKFKLAVLINEGSASASEIVAGAVQDHDRALVVGTKSFGKASVQTIIPMEDGTGLRLTTAYYYTPLGRHIQKTGIEPDVDLKEELQKQKEQEQEDESKTKDKDQAQPNRFPRPTVDLAKDQVLRTALDWLKSDVALKQYKQEHKKKETQDKAAQAEAD
jgi:carboxyl-terminal processing protease